MRREDLVEEYHDWLLDQIRLDDYCDRYERLLIFLSTEPFRWSMPHDENRAEDGFALRWKFSDVDFWTGRLPDRCSVLEMMIALSMRCEDVVWNPDDGNRVAEWFWEMVWNMGLMGQTNEQFSRVYCKICVDSMLNRQFCRNGKGGLFRTKSPKIDMRKAEIWYQMNVWLEENFEF